MHHRFRPFGAIVICALLGSGCALFRDESRPAVPAYPQAGEKAPLVRLVFTEHRHLANGYPAPPERGPFESREAYERRLREIVDELSPHVLKAFGEWQGIRMTGPGQDDQADLVAEVAFVSHERFSEGLAFLSGFTMTLIPASADIELSLETKLKRPDGTEIATLSESEQTDFWVEFFLLFAMPFRSLSGTTYDVYYDLARRTLVSGAEKELWRVPEPVKAKPPAPAES